MAGARKPRSLLALAAAAPPKSGRIKKKPSPRSRGALNKDTPLGAVLAMDGYAAALRAIKARSRDHRRLMVGAIVDSFRRAPYNLPLKLDVNDKRPARLTAQGKLHRKFSAYRVDESTWEYLCSVDLVFDLVGHKFTWLADVADTRKQVEKCYEFWKKNKRLGVPIIRGRSRR